MRYQFQDGEFKSPEGIKIYVFTRDDRIPDIIPDIDDFNLVGISSWI